MYDPIALTLSALCIIVIIGVIIGFWWKNDKKDDIYNRDMSDIVNQINDSQYYAYTFDKKQEENVKNLENNIIVVDNKVKNTMTSFDKLSKDYERDVDQIKQNYLLKSDLSTGVAKVQTDSLHFADKYAVKTDEDNNLVIMDSSAKEPSGTLVTKAINTSDMNVTGSLSLSSKASFAKSSSGPMIERNVGSSAKHAYGVGNFADGSIRLYGASGVDPSSVRLSFAKDNNQFSDVLTVSKTGVKVDANMEVARSVNINEKLNIADPMSDLTGNPYSLQKISDMMNPHLRLSINNSDANSFQIWGGACGLGECQGPGELKHKFNAKGDSWHQGSLQAKTMTAIDTLSAPLITADRQICIKSTCLNEAQLEKLVKLAV